MYCNVIGHVRLKSNAFKNSVQQTRLTKKARRPDDKAIWFSRPNAKAVPGRDMVGIRQEKKKNVWVGQPAIL